MFLAWFALVAGLMMGWGGGRRWERETLVRIRGGGVRWSTVRCVGLVMLLHFGYFLALAIVGIGVMTFVGLWGMWLGRRFG